MKVKEYKIFKTATKTAKENNLVFKDKENVFDFSLLDSMETPLYNFLKNKITHKTLSHV
ncbi:MAG: hypothetical protein HFJ41_08955 [Clostridia bacterium]|nr:hypothetical protein [Clostridia bacterium]